MLTVHTNNPNSSSLIARDMSVSWDVNGDNVLQLDGVDQCSITEYPRMDEVYVYEDGLQVWSGFLAESTKEKSNRSLTAFGDIRRLAAVTDYTRFWSKSDFSDFVEFTEDYPIKSFPINPNSALFDLQQSDESLYIGLRGGYTYAPTSGGGFYWSIPDHMSDRFYAYALMYEFRLPSDFQVRAYLRNRNGTGVIFASNSTTGPTNYNVRRGVFYATDIVPLNSTPAHSILIALTPNAAGTAITVNDADPDGFWYARFSAIRLTSNADNVYTRTVVAPVTSGSLQFIRFNDNANIYEGSLLVSPSIIGLVPSLVTASGIFARVDTALVSGMSFTNFTIPSSTVLRDVMTISGFAWKGMDVLSTTDDNANLMYDNVNAFETVNEIAEFIDYDVYAHNRIITARPKSQRRVYYSNTENYTLTTDLFNSPGIVRAVYDGIDTTRATNRIKTFNQETRNLIRRETLDYTAVQSGVAHDRLRSYAQSPVMSKSQVEINELFNFAGFKIPLNSLVVPASVIINNLSALDPAVKASYALIAVEISKDSAKYTLDEYPDSIEKFIS